MNELIYHIRVKKEYASSLIEDLQQVDAIEIIEEVISNWQKQETLKRLADMKANPDSVIEEDTFFDSIGNNDMIQEWNNITRKPTSELQPKKIL